MNTPPVRDMALLNGFFAVLLLVLAAVYGWISFTSAQVARDHVGKPDLVANALYEQRQYDKLRNAAISCYALQDELFVRSLRGSAKGTSDTAWVLCGLAALLTLNAVAFRRLAKGKA